MIKEFKCYTLLCDNCGADVNEYNEYSGYEDIENSREIANELDWIEHEGKDYCSDCYYYDDENIFYIQKNRTNGGKQCLKY